MARTPEGRVKDRVTAVLREIEAYYFFPQSGIYGRSGIPDIIACINGRFIAIECKAGKNEATALQLKEVGKINEAGGFAVVVNEQNLDRLEAVLHMMHKGERV